MFDTLTTAQLISACCAEMSIPANKDAENALREELIADREAECVRLANAIRAPTRAAKRKARKDAFIDKCIAARIAKREAKREAKRNAAGFVANHLAEHLADCDRAVADARAAHNKAVAELAAHDTRKLARTKPTPALADEFACLIKQVEAMTEALGQRGFLVETEKMTLAKFIEFRETHGY